MKPCNDIKNLRSQFTSQFYLHNKMRYTAAITATFLSACSNLVISWLLQQIIDAVSGNTRHFSLTQLSFISIAILGGILLISVLDYYSRPYFIKKAMQQYKNFIFEKISEKSIHSFSTENTATYLSALSNDINSIELNYLAKSFTLIQEMIQFVGAFGMMLYFSPFLTLVAVMLSLFPFAASLLTGRQLAQQEKIVSDKNENFIGTVKDILSGFSVIKSFKAEREVNILFAKSNEAAELAKCNRSKTELIVQTVGQSAGIIAQFGVFLFGAYLALTGRGITAGIVIIFVQLMNFVITPIASVPQILANRTAALALIDKLASAIQTNISRDGVSVDAKLSDAIILKDLTFAYEEGMPILNAINMQFEKGKSYAIVGSSGSGKSTLLNLMIGSREDYQGEIFYDKKELRAISSDSLFDLVSIVQQNVFVFNSTILDNITMFGSFTQDRIDQAIRMSGLATLIAERGNDYTCGENGNALSGGERQRISIARCLLRGTPVMLVDEATAALDAGTAYSISKSILEIPDLTRVIITHRLEESLLQKYDQILVLRNGSIEECGSFTELMAKKSYFYSLFTIAQ